MGVNQFQQEKSGLNLEVSWHYRRDLRHELKRGEEYGLKWFETKGFLSSKFFVSGEQQNLNAVVKWLNKQT